MSGIFISYRRKDTAYIAGRLHDRLAEHFGPGQIFRDIETIKPGVDFGQLIDEQVGSCDAFLAVIGDNWLVDRNPGGKRPIGVPRDWVQREIEVALARPDVLVVPVLVESVTMPSEQELPYSIRALAGRHAMELSDRRWDYEVEQLIEALEAVVQPEQAASPAALGRGDEPSPAEVPDQTPLSERWAGRGPATSGSGAAGQTWEPRTVPLAEPSSRPSRPTIPTWLKVVAPVALVALLVLVAVVALGSSGDGDDAAGTTSTLSTASSGPGQPTFPSFPGLPGMSGAGATVKVERVERPPDRTRLHLRVKNGGTAPLVLPPQSFTATDNTGHRYKVHPDAEEFPDPVLPGSEVAAVVDLAEPLRPGAKTLDVGWASVVGGLGFTSLSVRYTLP